MIELHPEQVRLDLYPQSQLPVREHLTKDGKTLFLTDGDYDGELASYYSWRFVNGYLQANLGGYIRVKEGGAPYPVYLQQLMMPTKPPGLLIRFINGNKLDARSANLEFITSSNLAAARQVGNSNKGRGASGYIGVHDMATGKREAEYLAHPHWKRYQTIIGHGSRLVFATAEEAAREYDRLCLAKYGKYAVLNFPREHLDK